MDALHRWNIVFVALAVAATWAFYKLSRMIALFLSHRKVKSQHGCKPLPERRSWIPYFGFDLFISDIRHYYTHTLLENGRKIMQGFLPARTYSLTYRGRKIYVTTNPELVKHILSTHFKDFQLSKERKEEGRKILGNGIFTTEGEAWRHSREMLRPCFSRDQIDDLAHFEKHVSRLMDVLPHDTSETVDLQPLFHKLTLDISTEFLFGQSADSLLPEDAGVNAGFVKAYEDMLEGVANPSRALIRQILPDREWQRNIKYVHDYVEQFARQALEKRGAVKENHRACDNTEKEDMNSVATHKRYILLDELVSHMSDAQQIRAELLSLLFAGRDTTAALLSNFFFILGKRPDVVEKLRTEIDDTLPDSKGKPTMRHLKDMTYLRYCLNETLRLYPIVPANGRVARKDIVLPSGGGSDGTAPLFIPKNTFVVFDSYTMQRREDLFGPEPNEFRPERWTTIRPGWGYVPFNGGPRVCIGQQFALTEASYTIVRMLQRFPRIEAREEGEWTEKFMATCKNLLGCKLALWTEKGR